MMVSIVITAVIVGLSLGLLGAGGSILLVPALMLLLDLPEKQAIAHALLIVPFISIFGAYQGWRAKRLDWRILFWFAIASIPAAMVSARLGLILPMGFQSLILIALLVVAAFKMWRPQQSIRAQHGSSMRLLLIGGISGAVTGMVGIGGGFLIVPALTLFAGVAMQTAVAISLVMIVFNGLAAFISLQVAPVSPVISWQVVGIISAIGALAVVVAGFIANKLDPQIIKRLFASVLLLVALLMSLDLLV
ncbi:sulfite exporter TauE/SafE family protein [Aliiglaciecola sp. M165]|uniref:sulfite exporter TauE/SafE family protein n=1 Tax=Aliiglaciecola sp. M165 TaxID=2593649 RepID=UPI00117C55FF|nr:sulfite exporter TauE/SafE family protein [Aliiglaciecola sp. M165]TRY33305.1 sulfite exporter TauE/SafE family protein [Aliiglaciecola sp. M165]